MTTPTHKVYILHSQKTHRFYTGCTDNPDRRLEFHNSGTTPSTKSGIP
ncbi:MAG TPA: GIY-YIG nuclease family protein [Flavilitoribacter sp.]|nr:GIY-YIG nuclease family protein [Flavilitoribacter sp.]HMQ91401.1 GIY-YIG nuclease family protein [Flavilitoribacter sp.]